MKRTTISENISHRLVKLERFEERRNSKTEEPEEYQVY